ncbi:MULTISPECIES: hypothetical protein [Pseudomonas]|uniref:Uncharacterized protein n=1 Tax=Pseudomonas lutea TaxID=243924 RepID=A0A9X8QLQ8_9PSED|nr:MULTISPECIES: hypothetical protein [Pseudomonas]SER36621.1 hypothetical protein SAMN05216409_11860 [Pseudomonas lutea]
MNADYQAEQAKRAEEAAQYQAWIHGLSYGDKVAYGNGRTWTLYTVERLTATQIVTLEGARFRLKDGGQVGVNQYWHIQPVTDEVQAQMQERANRTRFACLKPERLSAQQIAAALKAIDDLDLKPMWTKAEITEFDQLVNAVSSLNQVKRIEANFKQREFVEKHGQEKCDAMFKHLESGGEKEDGPLVKASPAK